MPSQGRRSTPLPTDWERIRARILRRDGHACRWTMETDEPCGEPANHVDHKVPAYQGGSDHDSNLQALCQWHHDRKTGAEASAVAHARPPRRRPPEDHPGLIISA